MSLGDILIDYREKNKLSQRAFAKKCDLSHALISILELGKNKQTGKKPTPDMETYKKLASGMGITVKALFEMIGDSEMINIGTQSDHPIVVPNSERFVKLIRYMPTEDYVMVMEAFERAEKRLKEEEESQK